MLEIHFWLCNILFWESVFLTGRFNISSSGGQIHRSGTQHGGESGFFLWSLIVSLLLFMSSLCKPYPSRADINCVIYCGVASIFCHRLHSFYVLTLKYPRTKVTAVSKKNQIKIYSGSLTVGPLPTTAARTTAVPDVCSKEQWVNAAVECPT